MEDATSRLHDLPAPMLEYEVGGDVDINSSDSYGDDGAENENGDSLSPSPSDESAPSAP